MVPEYGCKNLSFLSHFLPGSYYVILTMICISFNYKTERVKPSHFGKNALQIILELLYIFENIFGFEAYLLNLYWFLMCPNEYTSKRSMTVFM